MTTVKERADLDATRIRALRHALDQRHVSVRHQTVDLDYTLSETLPDNWQAPDDVTPEAAERLRMIGSAALQGSGTATTEIERYDHGVRSIHEVTCLPDRAEDGTIDGIVTVIADVTEAREREMALESLMREVSHRSKNLLAIVLSIAAQTANHTGGLDDFLMKFRGRIHALASTQDLVVERDWSGIAFHALVRAQVARDSGTPDAVRLRGDNPTLGPNAAMHVGLALHELITNARLYGALSNGTRGDIRVGAKLEYVSGGALQLVIDWLEYLPPTHPEPAAAHFGTAVLRQVVPRALDGRAEFDIGEDSVRYRLVVPGNQFAR